MTTQPGRPQILRNQSGMIIADFVFALTLTAGMSILLFSLSYSLAVVEVTQYVSFSVARAYMAGNKDHNEQEAKAKAKYNSLTKGKTAVSALYGSGWFTVGSEDELMLRGGPTGNGLNFSEDLGGGTDRRGLFLGASFPLTLNILKMNLPLIGDTAPDVDDDSGPKSQISTMLIREPTMKECHDFLEQRRNALRTLPSGNQFYDPASYIRLEDNGC